MVDRIKNNLNNIKFSINDKILIIVLIINGFSILISVFLTYIFSSSLVTILCGISIGITIGVMINYFILTKYNLIKKINIGFTTVKIVLPRMRLLGCSNRILRSFRSEHPTSSR